MKSKTGREIVVGDRILVECAVVQVQEAPFDNVTLEAVDAKRGHKSTTITLQPRQLDAVAKVGDKVRLPCVVTAIREEYGNLTADTVELRNDCKPTSITLQGHQAVHGGA